MDQLRSASLTRSWEKATNGRCDNKRSGAFQIIDFLNRNSCLLHVAGQPLINDIGLAVLAL